MAGDHVHQHSGRGMPASGVDSTDSSVARGSGLAASPAARGKSDWRPLTFQALATDFFTHANGSVP